jgi:hypothetical protein
MITAAPENIVSLVNTVSSRKGRESEPRIGSNRNTPARKSLPLNQTAGNDRSRRRISDFQQNRRMKLNSLTTLSFTREGSPCCTPFRCALNGFSTMVSLVVSKFGEPTTVGWLCFAISALSFSTVFWLAFRALSLVRP